MNIFCRSSFVVRRYSNSVAVCTLYSVLCQRSSLYSVLCTLSAYQSVFCTLSLCQRSGLYSVLCQAERRSNLAALFPYFSTNRSRAAFRAGVSFHLLGHR